jgi:membrane protein DedA with SNARE-associated domain
MNDLFDSIYFFVPRLLDWIREMPWPLTLLVLALAVSVKDRVMAVIAVLLVAGSVIDIRVGLSAIMLGQLIGVGASYYRGRELRRHTDRPRVIGRATSARTPGGWFNLARRRPLRTALRTRFMPGEHGLAFTALGFVGHIPPLFALASALAWVLWMAFFAGVTLGLGAPIQQFITYYAELPGLIVGIIIAVLIPQALALGLTYHGRRLARARLSRCRHREYWPMPLIYGPLLPLVAWWALRRRSLMVFTCCNPGIGFGGGIIGESKKEILDALGDGAGAVLPHAIIPAGADPDQRTRRAMQLLGERPELGGLPVILKPDVGQRGHGVKLARSAEDVRRYFRSARGPVLIQRYHPGPLECGVLWARYPDGPRPQGGSGRAGFIFSITRKDFPVITGDGVHTLEELILDHPRFHKQSAIFLERFAHQRQRTLKRGETLRLAESGNHCQGTLFRDGGDLWTPELEARIDALAAGFRPLASTVAGPLLDIGRFDIRYESDEALRQGRGFAIVEFNGTTGESTNIYDPARSVFWMYRTLARQWRLAYELGATRRDAGAVPISLLELALLTRRYRHGRGSPMLAD